jgi:hypothetical protein
MCMMNGVLNSYEEDGIVLNDSVLARLTEGEQLFWHDFLSHAEEEKMRAEAAGKKYPIQASDSLRWKYMQSIIKYHGGIYRQVMHMSKVFDFSPPREK